MAHARTRSAVILGVEGHVVDVEAHLSPGLPAVAIVGLADAAVAESRDRARSAVLNSRLDWPSTRLTIGLSPAWLPKSGPALDLPIALAVLAAGGVLSAQSVAPLIAVGELALDGRIRAVRGVLVAALAAARARAATLVVPRANAQEAGLVSEISVLAIGSLAELVATLRGEPFDRDDHCGGNDTPDPSLEVRQPHPLPDLVDVRGHGEARAALEVVAAGGHHLAFVGPPGVGKTLMAERLPGILPCLGATEALEVTAVRSVVGALDATDYLMKRPPFCAPHHSTSFTAMVGGGSGRAPKVGLVSLAHHGVLFLDEAPEFAPSVLDSLRQPMESGVITIARTGFTASLPARFQLVIAANPCPCGRSGEADTADSCSCTPMQRRRYLGRVSGPLLDRIDVRVRTQRPTADELLSSDISPEPSSQVAQRVCEARDRAARRLHDTPFALNAQVSGAALRGSLAPSADGVDTLYQLIRNHRASARAADRVLRVAWTLADLRGVNQPRRSEVAAAWALRGDGWGEA